MNKSLKMKHAGLTLVEVILAVAILGIISLMIFPTLSSGLNIVYSSGDLLTEITQSYSELEIARVNYDYKGKVGQENLKITEETIDLFEDFSIETVYIQSKVGSIQSPLDTDSQYVFFREVKQEMTYKDGDPFIKKSGNTSDEFEEGDIHLPIIQLKNGYTSFDNETLIIPSGENFTPDMQNLVFNINGDIKVLGKIDNVRHLSLNSRTGEVKILGELDGIHSLIIEGENISLSNNIHANQLIEIKSSNKISVLEALIIKSQGGTLLFEGKEIVFAAGENNHQLLRTKQGNLKFDSEQITTDNGVSFQDVDDSNKKIRGIVLNERYTLGEIEDNLGFNIVEIESIIYIEPSLN